LKGPLPGGAKGHRIVIRQLQNDFALSLPGKTIIGQNHLELTLGEVN
jgi:hypothetical protein